MRFIHLSDLHFNPSDDGRISRKLRADLITYLRDLELSADELLITGDFRHARFQGNEQEAIEEVVNYILEIAEAVHISSADHIHIVPGNHDRDRIDTDEEKAAQIWNNYDPDKGTFEKDDLNYLKKQFGYFNMVCSALYGTDCFWDKAELHTYRFRCNTVFLYLNTAIMHNSDKDRYHLIIGNDCLDRLLREIDEKYPGYPIIVLAHHSPDYFEKHEKEAVEEIFKDHPMLSLYLCGDAHEAWLRKVNGHLEITMGCIKHDKEVEKTFLYGNTDSQEYSVHHWVRAWEPFRYFNEALEKYFPHTLSKLTPIVFEQEQNRLKNDTLLPWMRNSPSLGALFPSLFVEPIYYSEKLRYTYITFSDILEKNKNAHIIITGDAGMGKTTLLRQQFLYENTTGRFLYLHAKALTVPVHELRSYQKYVRNLLLYGIVDDYGYLVFLDGMDEAYAGNIEELNNLIDSINKLEKTCVWFGWRREHLAQSETEALRQMTHDTISLSKWTPQMAHKFIEWYAHTVKKPNIIIDFDSLVCNNDTIRAFTESPFQLALLTYLLENKETDSAIADFFIGRDKTIYNLYSSFFLCWLKKERDRTTSHLPIEEIKKALWEISNKLYYNPTCEINYDDTAIVDLLTFSNLGFEKIANGFFHRSFCAFFLADKVFNAVKVGDICLIEALKIPLRNDVTDFVRSAISGSDNSEIVTIQENLISAYRQIDAPKDLILSEKARNAILEMDIKHQFTIKNEIIYLVTRIPDPTSCIPNFLEEINAKNTDPYILLDIAYAATLTGPTYIALDYAKTLEPGSENSLINRSWTLAYFGDVQANPHEYRDIEKVPWIKSREARMKRFQKSNYKALRFRILDFPLLYCYYVDRNWKDVNDTDYKIISNTEIEHEVFSAAEKLFLKQKKEQLLQGFREHML